jgi:hypothetical protein
MNHGVKTWILGALATGACLTVAGLATGGVIVQTDSGSQGGFTLTSDGTHVSIGLTGTGEFISNINGIPQAGAGHVPVTFTSQLNLLLTSKTSLGNGSWNFTFVPTGQVETIGASTPGGRSTSLMYMMETGNGSASAANVFSVHGPSNLLTQGASAYDFSPFNDPSASMALTLTATARSNAGQGTFADLIADGGTVWGGSSTFSQLAPLPMPEPTTAVLFVVGAGMLWMRRRK